MDIVLGTIDIAKISHLKVRSSGVQEKPSIKQLRLKAGWSAFNLAVRSGVSISTINRMETGKRKVSLLSVNRVLNALSDALKQELTLDSVQPLNIEDEKIVMKDKDGC
jgi:transcriptional regulator with XRE-family HTH domain